MLTTSCSGTSSMRDLRDLLGPQVAVVDRLHLALQPAQIEEQLLLRRRGAHLHQRELRRMYSWTAARIHPIA